MYSAVFVTLLLALLAFASPNTNVSSYNPFQALVLKTPPKSGPPICCLKPQKNSDSLDDDVLLLSFEEWKAKQAELQARESGDAGMEGRNESGKTNGDENRNGGSNNETDGTHASTPASNSPDWDAGYVEEQSPHFLVPLTDRFNYASLDCSARIHLTHRSAKSASSILSSKRDKYMLSPCREGKQFVIVELCEDIRIDTVQMANYEFFSGVFKDFEVSVAKTYNPDSWVDAGRYRAKNIRGVQSFHPPRSLRDFYRFIRIDFHSHYGTEYYCPISLLRVYGLTHLEQWKWDIWEAESKAKKAGPSDRAVEIVAIPKQVQYVEPVVDVIAEEKQLVTEPVSGVSTVPLSTSSVASDTTLPSMPPSEVPSNSLSPETNSTTTPTTQSTPTTNTHDVNDNEHTDSPPPHHSTDTYVSSQAASQAAIAQSSDAPLHDAKKSPIHSPESPSSLDSSTTPQATPILPSYNPSADTNSSVIPTPVSVTSLSTTIVASTLVKPTAQSSSTVSVQHVPSPPPPPPSPPHGSPFAAGNGESIYRVIMNRLMALETNHTLYARYVEDQIGGISEVLKRLSEDVGRLDGIGKRQAQMFTKTVKEWEKYRNRVDNQYVELMHRVNYLADEVMLEKRLGIAQLCLLLAVLVFMGLTRGSRMSEGDLQSLLAQRIADRDRRERDRERIIGRTERLPNAGRVREWGRRHLSSISGDWVNRFARSQSRGSDDAQKLGEPDKENVAPAQVEDSKHVGLVEFPSLSRKPQNHTKRRIVAKPRSRTPSLRTPLSASKYYLNNGGSPTTHRTANVEGPTGSMVQKAYSQGHLGGMSMTASWSGIVGREVIPRSSVKRWARSAHLHEVKISRRHGRSRTSSGDNGGEESQVNKMDGDNNQVADRREEAISADKQIDDVFTSPPSAMKGNGYLSAFERGPLYGRHAPHSLLVYPGPSLMRRRSANGEGESDWVDTDATESLEGGSEFGSL